MNKGNADIYGNKFYKEIFESQDDLDEEFEFWKD